MRVRISTWNCFGMAQGLGAITHTHAPAGLRLRDVGLLDQCSLADVLCVQELFSREAQQFFDRLHKHAFRGAFRDDNRLHLRTITARGSGLGIGARPALRRTLLRSFPGRSTGWDRLARKGSLYAQLALDDGTLVDVLTSHLQAGYDPLAAQVRAAQLVELRRHLDEVGSPERPFVVCGDFNIDGLAKARGNEEYRRLAQALEGFEDLGASCDLPTFHPHPEANALAHHFEPEGWPQRIDYIFFRPASRGPRLRCCGFERILDQPLSHTLPHGDLPSSWPSDHYGLTATFEQG